MHNKQSSSCGMVFAMTNEAIRNKVIAYYQGRGGRLTSLTACEYETGGSGTGMKIVDPLSSQGSLVLSPDGCFLFAVNAGSGSISSFRISKSGKLALVDVEPSGGAQPNSLAVFDNFLYVVNAGNASSNIAANITGFRVGTFGDLTPMGYSHFLSSINPKPSCIVFSHDGSQLVVSESNTNHLSVFNFNIDGNLTGPVINTSNSGAPYGSVFLRSGLFLVTEVGSNSEAGPNAISSYIVAAIGTLTVISGSVQNNQMATSCWIVPSPGEHFAYTSNPGSDKITVYRIKKNGTLTVMGTVHSTPEGAAGPIDNGVSKDGRNFYVLNGNEGSISVFRVKKKGEICRIQVFRDTGLPKIGAQGLAVL